MYDRKSLPTSCAIVAAVALTFALGLAGCKSSPPAPPTDDASLTTALQSRIAGDGALSAEPIQSAVQNRVATLTGTVSNEAARSLAAADAAQVPGIKTVVNNLTVQAPPTGHQRRSRTATATAGSRAGLTKIKEHPTSRKAKICTDRPPGRTSAASTISGCGSPCSSTGAKSTSAASTATRLP